MYRADQPESRKLAGKHEFTIEARPGETVYLPIDSFRTTYMQADSSHTNAFGYEIIAQALVQTLKQDRKVNDNIANAISKKRLTNRRSLWHGDQPAREPETL